MRALIYICLVISLKAILNRYHNDEFEPFIGSFLFYFIVALLSALDVLEILMKKGTNRHKTE